MASRLINGLVLVVVGAILLMNTTGYLPWAVWDAAWGYWPILLIGLGLQVAFTRWRFPGVALAMVVILILAAMNPYTGSNPFIEWNRRILKIPSFRPIESSRDWSVPLRPSVSRLDLQLEAPSLNVEARGDASLNASPSELAVSGKLSWNRVEPRATVAAGGAEDTVKAALTSPAPLDTDGGTQTWVLALNPSLATSMDVSGGVTNLTLDMSSAFLESLNVNAGISKLNLTLGLTGKETRISVTGGVGNLTLQVPQAAGIKIDLRSPLTLTNDFAQQGLSKAGSEWVTPDYEGSNTKVFLTITCGTGKVTLQRGSRD